MQSQKEDCPKGNSFSVLRVNIGSHTCEASTLPPSDICSPFFLSFGEKIITFIVHNCIIKKSGDNRPVWDGGVANE